MEDFSDLKKPSKIKNISLLKEEEEEVEEVDNGTKLRVLAIDAQIFSLQFLCVVLHDCNYTVKTTSSADEALQILTENNHGFDVVLVDVDSANLDGFKLLATIGLELYLPVIMVTEDGSLENIRKGLLYGAVDYIIKPIGVQKIKNTISNCVTLNKFMESANQQSGDYQKTSDHDQNSKPLKHSNASIKVEEDEENFQPNDASSSSPKKKRLVWTPALNAKFLKAVQILSERSMVHPKRILKIMNEPGLTRDNVASHLQKYRNKRKVAETSQGFESERVIQSSSTMTSTKRRKWEVGDINAGHQAVPSFNRFHSLEDTNSVALNQIRVGNVVTPQLMMMPYGSSLVPNTPYQSLLYSCLEMNAQPHNFGSQQVSETASLSPYFHDVSSQPSTSSRAPFYPPRNAFLVSETDDATLVPNILSGFSTDCTSDVQYPGSAVLTRNDETELIPNGTMISSTDSDSQHNLERVDEVSEMDNLEEENFDYYSLFNIDDEYDAGLTSTV